MKVIHRHNLIELLKLAETDAISDELMKCIFNEYGDSYFIDGEDPKNDIRTKKNEVLKMVLGEERYRELPDKLPYDNVKRITRKYVKTHKEVHYI